MWFANVSKVLFTNISAAACFIHHPIISCTYSVVNLVEYTTGIGSSSKLVLV